MPEPRFLQIHTLTAYPAALLNRDDSGLAKRLTYGGVIRTRVSSQCLKRHWRIADDPNALHAIDGADAAYRSRELVTRKVLGSLSAPASVMKAIEPEFQMAVYGDKGTAKSARQTLLLGEREIAWLRAEAERLAGEADGDAAAAKTLAADWRKTFRDTIKAMREVTALPGGLVGALFGRMVTSDPEANITAPVHVAHAFTVGGEETESDYFTAVDDLADDAPGADTIQETELTSGLYYGYVVVDLPGLKRNLGPAADTLAGPVLHNLVHLIAEVSPGAKLGSTAPYSRASFMLLEAGDRQPRSLAEAFHKAVRGDATAATRALAEHLGRLDAAYATGEERHFLSLRDETVPGAGRGTLKVLADFAAALPGRIA
ncbi:type I-E CRISPR-associated protein Cas7/Cse4/CasC [Methylobacterium thuringiense]|uniref:CRISPR system Cascade subunit CasC n=1 Tax=Methylobacterium thuringiense TaxID=1003091 RepID=A0ABQ4TT65_9HYPH|nr:type I-E CRISPR-associated protein Cas7/Cse4/CasC [Methylobacterium thuringiense]GJE57843.1 CRISPR system Cascade subunit CasC [Methylobacterium thuringiense]